MDLADFDYALPESFIAQTPVEPRDSARLMVLDRARKTITHSIFREIGSFLSPGDVLIVNDTRVIPARLLARKAGTGGRVELLLLKRRAPLIWECLVGGRGLNVGACVELEGQPDLQAVVMEAFDGPRRLVQFSKPVSPLLEKIGRLPLPPYIHEAIADPERYQTVYARSAGSAAAPTAGLHFTPQLIDRLAAGGLRLGYVTLHVGLDTFAPVTEARVEDHRMHGEWGELNAETAALVNHARREGRRVVAVGTTSVRLLETAGQAAVPPDAVAPWEGTTDLYILPGHTFRAVDAFVTNFHLPRTTLLMLVSAFAGRDFILAAYEEAKRQAYRFYSFGDAMLIL